MGTEITLDFGGVSLSYAKNHRGMDHGALFQDADRRRVRSDQIDYDYFEREGEDPAAMEAAFTRKLRDVIPRLDLLGYTFAQARLSYDHWVKSCQQQRSDDDDDGPAPFTFDEFRGFVCRFAIEDLDNTFVDSDTHKDGKDLRGRFTDESALFQRVPQSYDHDDMAWSERSFLGNAVNVLHPYFMLQIFAGNAANLETDVVWQYGPLVDAGWAQTGEFNSSARRTETFLIATEGSSDAHILQQALRLLRPAVLDFFRFIDVSERHPFPGTGNLVKFAEGLAKIDVHNQIIFVFDNDAEGIEAYQKVRCLSLPANMRAMVLPDLEAFKAFAARGPEGDHLADINGRGAAIECYLDHRLGDYPPPRVVWTNYKPDLNAYQGALEHKESYAKAFLRLKADNVGSYDTAKICDVLEAVIARCVETASACLTDRIEHADG